MLNSGRWNPHGWEERLVKEAPESSPGPATMKEQGTWREGSSCEPGGRLSLHPAGTLPPPCTSSFSAMRNKRPFFISHSMCGVFLQPPHGLRDEGKGRSRWGRSPSGRGLGSAARGTDTGLSSIRLYLTYPEQMRGEVLRGTPSAQAPEGPNSAALSYV